MKFTQHFNNIISKAFKMLGFLIRTCRNFSKMETVMLLYKTLVRSQLEYASVIWSPASKTYADAIEKVQRKFTRYIFRKFCYPYQFYEDRLLTLNLCSLHVRRKEMDMKFLYKMMNGIVSTTCIADMIVRYNQKNIRNMNIFGLRRYNTKQCKNSLVTRMM